MMSNIIFIGGIHGVGKSSICQHICRELNIEYLSASNLLQWKNINEDPQNKLVKDISYTQNSLIWGLANVLRSQNYYLLDGHYCLLNSNNEIVKISPEVFKQIDPISLNLLLGNISEVKNRLEQRDNKVYDYDLLERFQKEELAHAKLISKTLGITLNICTQYDYSKLIILLRSFLPSKL
ncbi:MAG: ATP-binding protein [Sporocytophaga sp.]|nr:ATP-binding protein [Sporocytophaga sp.]